YAIFNQSMHDRLVKLHELEVELQNALKRGEFQPYFQPIVSLNSLTLSGFEVLMRWKHPKRGIIPPGEFIELCEKNGLIEPMTYSILRQACRKLFYWQEMLPDLTISVNLSGTHFSQEDLYSVIESIINESNIMPSSLKLELTEGKIMEDAERAVEILDKFKKLGTQIMIDDFGTGYSNLSYLHRFPVDALKIDRSFVTGMERDSEKAAIVRTIITLAKALGLTVVAEGVENVHQLYQLRELGCQMGQGFLFSKPLPPEMAEKMLLERFNWQHLLPAPQTQPTRQISSTPPIQTAQLVSQTRSSQMINKEVNPVVQKTEPVAMAKEAEQIEAEILDIPIIEANASSELIDLSIVEVEDTKLH
ncbi:MAG: EAL domain-containing protein, partial [Acidobacteria bacterium]